jgi:predicted molibdopterin-dependent oxidoreductase YjgC
MEKAGHGLGLSWEKTRILLTEKIKSLIYHKATARLAIVLNTRLTNEELFLADRIFRKELHLENIFVVDPPPGKDDGFLLTEERTPNKRGLGEIGLPAAAPDLKVLAEKTDLLFVFGSDLAERSTSADLQAALGKIRTKVLLASHISSLDSLVDIIIPTPLIGEKSGSLTNVEGKVQAFLPALDFRADGLPEWRLLLDLARDLKLNHQYFFGLDSPESIRQLLGKEIPFFNR